MVLRGHPADDRCLVLASLADPAEGACGCRTRVWPRRGAARYLVPGDPDRFFRNYRLAGTRREWGGDRTPLLEARWVPRHDQGGFTSRSIWIDLRTGTVVRLEDHSWEDGLIRSLARISPDVSDLEVPDASSPEMVRCLRYAQRPRRHGPPSPGRVAARAPFPLFAPRILPPGFDLVRANYWGRRGLAYLDYSDGFAVLSVAMGRREDLDAFEERMARSAAAHRDPDACPPIPEPVAPLRESGLFIRRRKDRCRTVLRVDDFHGVSVCLLGRNEIPEECYLEAIESLVQVEPEADAEK